MATIKARYKLRAGTSAAWGSANPILLAGEPGIETDTKRMRIGDGATPFTSLPYVTFDTESYQTVNAVLTGLIALGSGPNKGLYFSGINTLAEFDLTAFGRSLLSDATASAARTRLGAQVADAVLASIVALNLTAGDIIYATGPKAVARLAPDADGKILTLDGGLPAWRDAISTGSVLAATAAAVAGAIGTYAFAKRGVGNTDVAFGATAAGSDLRPCSAVGPNGGGVVGAALSGTWRAMGSYDHSVNVTGGSGENPTTTTYFGATLWLRIA